MPAPQPTADDLQQVLDRLARILNEREGLLVLKFIAMRRRTSRTFRAFSRRTAVRSIWIGCAASGGRLSTKTTRPS